jgi:hypothetical protein
LPWLIASTVALVVAVVVVGMVGASDDDSGGNVSSLGTQQLAAIQQACGQWQDGYAGSAVPSSAWCDDMVGWMTDRIQHGQMMGSMMWGDPDQMLATCREWMASNPRVGGSTPEASAWCGQMVSWMTQHMGDWDHWDRGWMMNAPMMSD